MEKIISSSVGKRCAVVTGANKGIGLEICCQLAGANKGIGLEICCQLASKGIFVVLTARNEKRGCEAVESLKASGFSHVIFHQLDVKDADSIASLSNFIKTHIGKLDILVNNAGEGGALIIDTKAFKDNKGFMCVSDENPDMLKGIMEQTIEGAEECLKTNYYGTKGVTEALLPFLQLSKSATIVNVSSIYGLLMFIANEKVKSELSSECLTEDQLDELLKWFLRDFKEEKLQTNGWPITVSAYKLSKAALNAYTRILAQKFPKMRINAVHPGYVISDITCNTGILTAEEGARAPVMLALMAEDGPTGQFFNQMEISTF